MNQRIAALLDMYIPHDQKLQGRVRGTAQLNNCISNPNKPVCPIIATPRQQPHVAALAARHQAEAVKFDFVNPAWSDWRVSGSGGEAGFDEAMAGSTQHKNRHGAKNMRSAEFSQAKRQS